MFYEGAVGVVAWLRDRGCPVAILTRNARRLVDVVLTRHAIRVDAVRAREDGAIKPSGAPVLALCSQLGTAPAESWMIGDSLFDIQSGRQAGMRTVLMIGDSPPPSFAGKADHVICRLNELPELVRPLS